MVGEAMAKATDFEKQFSSAHYADGRKWHFSLVLDPSQRAENYEQLDERAAWFYEATTTSAGMVTKTPGVGQIYLGTYKDKFGELARWRQDLSVARRTERADGEFLVADSL